MILLTMTLDYLFRTYFIPRITDFPRKKKQTKKDVSVHIAANIEEGQLRNTFESIYLLYSPYRISRWLSGKESAANAGTQETRVRSLGWKDHLEEEMATHSSIYAGKILWTEEPDRLHPEVTKSWT